MRLPEYKAVEIFSQYGVPCPRGRFFASFRDVQEALPELALPAVVKAQVQTGGRGKSGGIRVADSGDELLRAADEILKMTIKGQTVSGILVVEKLSITDEWYLSAAIDRKEGRPVLIFSAQGGMEINEVASRSPDQVVKTFLIPGMPVVDPVIRYFVDRCQIDPKLADPLGTICRSLVRLFEEYDCLLAEINPLVVTPEGTLIAADGKVEIDDNALFRHEDIRDFRDRICGDSLVLEARRHGFLYIPVQRSGTVGLVSNGSGMIMASIDLLSKAGHATACALDLGGGATSQRVAEAIEIVAKNPEVEVLFINIFGGITRCDEIAGGVRLAVEKELGKTAVVRFEGTNKEAGLQVLRTIGCRIEIAEGLSAGVRKISETLGRASATQEV